MCVATLAQVDTREGALDRDSNIHGTHFTQKEKGQGGPAGQSNNIHT